MTMVREIPVESWSVKIMTGLVMVGALGALAIVLAMTPDRDGGSDGVRPAGRSLLSQPR